MKSLFPYAGGKFHLIKIVEQVYKNSNKTAFIDVFGGSGKVLMNMESKVKVYNDIDNSLVNIFETLRNNPGLLKDKFEYALNSRRLFNECKIEGNDNAENAFRKLYSYLMSFAGKGKYYGYSVKSKGNRIINIKENIDSIYNEVKYWTIENIDYKELIKKYDSQGSFFYLDPPYYKIKYYRYNFNDSDFHELKDILGKIKGKYLMNINYNDFVVDLFGEPDMKIEVKNNSVNNKYIKNSKRYELFYYN
jgi:DNA adenine methylase